MEYSKIPDKIRRLKEALQDCSDSLPVIEKAIDCGKQVSIRLLHSGLGEIAVDAEKLYQLLDEQQDKLQKELNHLSDVDETLRKVSVGLV